MANQPRPVMFPGFRFIHETVDVSFVSPCLMILRKRLKYIVKHHWVTSPRT
jgi:hypothetical protein